MIANSIHFNIVFDIISIVAHGGLCRKRNEYAPQNEIAWDDWKNVPEISTKMSGNRELSRYSEFVSLLIIFFSLLYSITEVPGIVLMRKSRYSQRFTVFEVIFVSICDIILSPILPSSPISHDFVRGAP